MLGWESYRLPCSTGLASVWPYSEPVCPAFRNPYFATGLPFYSAILGWPTVLCRRTFARMHIPFPWTRRRFLQAVALASGNVVAGGFPARAAVRSGPVPQLTAADLPKGAGPAALVLPHFPSRLHAFVWRNWSLVPVPRMAAVVGARPAEIAKLGRAMGLGRPARITNDQQRRSYITVIKRNWHLLPYDQLLDLLGWSAGEMAFTLREDDFLYVKLGNLKPQCEPLRWSASDAATRHREQQMKRTVQAALGRDPAESTDALFSFVARLTEPPAKRNRPNGQSTLRFCYSYFALYGDPLLDPDADPYPDGLIERLAAHGVTGVWLQGMLSRLATFPWDPPASQGASERLKNLRRLVASAGRHGIRVFLYLNEPRSLPLRFFATQPELKGVVEGDHATLCSSVPEVQRFLRESIAAICHAVPDLGGFFTITASENLTNCWSHGQGAVCPRCGPRGAAEVIAEVNGLIAAGIADARGSQRLLAWDWGWADAWAGDIIARLPAGVALMSVSEWSLPLNRGGVHTEVGEYSMSAIGPGPRAPRHWTLARARGLRTVAKIQAGNTWELAAVPYVPVVANVAQHAANLRQLGIQDVMLGWTLGGYPSPNLDVVAEVMQAPAGEPSVIVEHALAAVAERRFGPKFSPAVVQAWRAYSIAFQEFPYHGSVVYSAPLQNGPSNLLWTTPTGYRASMVGLPYDDLDQWRGPYPADVFAAQLENVAEGFDSASRALTAATRPEPGRAGRPLTTGEVALTGEIRVAEAAAIHWRSVANQTRFTLARSGYAAATDRTTALTALAEMEKYTNLEFELARRLHTLQCADARLGFEATNHYFYVPTDLAEKILNCRHVLDEWLPAERRKW